MLTPSSNTVLEPVSYAMLAGLPEVSTHFARFRVTQISVGDDALGQFDPEPMLEAARLLADAKVDVIAWNGTSAGWLGFDTDERLCALITGETGIPATSSVLALNEILRATGVSRLGLVTPYTSDVQDRIVANYRAAGIDCAERHLGISVNHDFASVAEPVLDRLVTEVAEARPDAITTLCTNLRAAPSVERWERAIGTPVYDSIAAVIWKSLTLAGVDPTRIKGWGRLFDMPIDHRSRDHNAE